MCLSSTVSHFLFHRYFYYLVSLSFLLRILVGRGIERRNTDVQIFCWECSSGCCWATSSEVCLLAILVSCLCLQVFTVPLKCFSNRKSQIDFVFFSLLILTWTAAAWDRLAVNKTLDLLNTTPITNTTSDEWMSCQIFFSGLLNAVVGLL